MHVTACMARYRSAGSRRFSIRPRPPVDGCAAHPTGAWTAPARSAGRRSATAHRLLTTIALGLTRRDAACPSWRRDHSTFLQATTIDYRPRLARAASPDRGARGDALQAREERRPAQRDSPSSSHAIAPYNPPARPAMRLQARPMCIQGFWVRFYISFVAAAGGACGQQPTGWQGGAT